MTMSTGRPPRGREALADAVTAAARRGATTHLEFGSTFAEAAAHATECAQRECRRLAAVQFADDIRVSVCHLFPDDESPVIILRGALFGD